MKREYRSSSSLQSFERVCDHVTEVELVPLVVLELIRGALVLLVVLVEVRQELSVVRHQSRASELVRFGQLLDELRRHDQQVFVSRHERGCRSPQTTLYGVHGFWEGLDYLSAALLQEVEAAENRYQPVRVFLFPQAFHEHRQVEAVVQVLRLHDPLDRRGSLPVDELDRQVASVVEAG